MGPNFKRLVAHRMSMVAIPDGGGLQAGLEFLTNPQRIGEVAREAEQFVRDACAVMKTAPNNPCGNDDEKICEMILQKIEERKKAVA